MLTRASDRRVKRLPRDPGPAAWSALLAPPAPARPLEEAVTADWLVIGGGFAGLAAARRLAQLRAPERIVLLEARRIGEGPAGRNSGFMIDLPHDLASGGYGGAVEADRRQIAMNRAAIAFAAGAVEEYALPREAFDPGGKINAAATGRGVGQNRAYARHLEVLGEPHDWLDAGAMRALTGTDYYLGGLRTPGTVILQPAMFVRGVAAGLGRAVALHEDAPVVRLARAGPDWRAETPTGSVTAPRVILAVNGHAESFGYFERRLMHVFTYASMSRRLTADEVRRLGGEPRWGLTPADPMGTTVRRISGTGGDRILVRNRFTYDPSMEVPETRLAAVACSHDASFAARFPMLAGVEMEYRWGGGLCLSRNGVPAFGEVEDGVFSACCQNGLGLARGTLAGMLAADLATRSNNPMLADLTGLAPPRPLPPEPLTWLGATTRIRWEEWQAGREL
ncbi:MAG TPA: FAD-binding oxidoreductase [Thermohalobaculum sp.]|nr:FAD-binding oxidoreductase [Thermohalobaculum sp.]